MKKQTHLLLTKYLLEVSDKRFSRFEKALVCFGSIAPDLTILCLVHPHCWTVTLNCSEVRLNKLKDFHYRYRDCLKLGLLSHHIADYFTAPHNRIGVSGFCTNHRCYEKRLNKIFKKNLQDKSLVRDLTCYNINEFWDYMINLHNSYVLERESCYTDFYYIFNAVSSLFSSVVYA